MSARSAIEKRRPIWADIAPRNEGRSFGPGKLPGQRFGGASEHSIMNQAGPRSIQDGTAL